MILSKKLTKFSLARHVWKEMLFTISIKMCIFFLFWPAEKGTHFKFQWNFTKQSGKLIFKHYFLLHLICYLAPQWFLWTTRNLCFSIYFYIAPKRSQKITIIFFIFVTGVKHTSWCLLRPWYMYCLNVTPAPSRQCKIWLYPLHLSPMGANFNDQNWSHPNDRCAQ